MADKLTRPTSHPYYHKPKCKNCDGICYPINDYAVLTPDQVIVTLVKRVFPRDWVPDERTIALLKHTRASRTKDGS